MKINGTGMGSTGVFQGGANASDALGKSLRSQIENAEKRLQDLAKNDQLSPEEKMKKRQELQKEISQLNQQLRQHEIELRREQSESKKSDKGSGADGLAGGKKAKEQEEAGLSKASMNALISADSAVGQAEAAGTVVARMKGEKGVLATEIKLDRSRGTSTAIKEDRVAELERRISDTTAGQIKQLGKANKQIREAAGKDREEKKEREKEAARAEKSGQAEEARQGSQAERPEEAAQTGKVAQAKEARQEKDGKETSAQNREEEAGKSAQKTARELRPGQIIDERL